MQLDYLVHSSQKMMKSQLNVGGTNDIISFDVTATTDITKKRKKWIDACLTLNKSNRSVRVYEKVDNCIDPTFKVKNLHSSVVDISKMNEILRGCSGSGMNDEMPIRLGHLLVSLTVQDQMTSTAIDNNSHQQSSDVIPAADVSKLLNRLTTPSTSNNISSHQQIMQYNNATKPSNIEASLSAHERLLQGSIHRVKPTQLLKRALPQSLLLQNSNTDDANNNNALEHTSPPTKIPKSSFTMPMKCTSSNALSLNNQPSKDDQQVDKMTSLSYLPTCFDRLTRRVDDIPLTHSFNHPQAQDYCNIFTDAVTEEILINCSKALQTVEQSSTVLLQRHRESRISKSSTSSSLNKLTQQHKPFLSTMKKLCSLSGVEDILRRGLLICSSNIEFIAPGSSTSTGNAYAGSNSYTSSSSRSQSQSYSKSKSKYYNKKHKRNNFDGDEDSELDPEDFESSTSLNRKSGLAPNSNASSGTSETQKLYLKFPISQQDFPKEATSVCKGDLWILWRENDRINTCDEVWTKIRNESTNASANSSTSISREYLDTVLQEYKDAQANLMYPFPWFKNIVWQKLWLVRSMWHGISDKGMHEVQLLTSLTPMSAEDKTSLVKLKKCNVIRLTNDMNTLTILDLLLSAQAHNPSSSTPPPIPSTSLTFSDLLESNVFTNGILSSNPNLNPNPMRTVLSSSFKPAHALLLGPNKANTPQSQSQQLPTFPDKLLQELRNEISSSFGLNPDQASVLQRVSDWFSSSSINSCDNIVLVHGVFGSGKSHLIVAICVFIKMLYNTFTCLPSQCNTAGGNNMRVLISSNTNVAVDRIMIALSEQHSSEAAVHVSIARVGCPSKIDARLRKTRGALVCMTESKASAMREVKEMIRRGDKDPELQCMLERITGKGDYVQAQRDVVAHADVIGVTCASTASSFLQQVYCPILILDEASQMTEPSSLLPIACSHPCKMILVGDPKQLPPAVAMTAGGPSAGPGGREERQGGVDGDRDSAKEASSADLSRSLFDRLLSLGTPSTLLRTQYRCHPIIGDICSRLFYEGQLIHGVDEQMRPPIFPGLPLVSLLEVQGTESKYMDSYSNIAEAGLIRDLLLQLIKAKEASPSFSIGVICLYKSQVYLINKRIAEDAHLQQLMHMISSLSPTFSLKVSTVDAFQGQEKDIIVISTCRHQWNSFISNPSRVNVAISRARHHLVLVGNKAMLSRAPLWSEVVSAAKTSAKSANELLFLNNHNSHTAIEGYADSLLLPTDDALTSMLYDS